MSVDREYRIKIALFADNSGAQQAERDFGKVGETAEENVSVFERLGVSHRALHGILHLIATESGPQAGAALAGMAVAGGGGIMIAIMAVKELVGWIHKLKEESDEAQKGLSQIGISARDAAENASTAWDAYLSKLNEAKDPAEKLEQVYKRIKAALDDMASAHEKILDDMEKEELAQAKGDKGREDEIRARYDQLKSAAGTASGQAQLDAHQKYLDELKGRQPDLNRAAAVAAGDVSYLQGHPFAPPGFKIDEDQENQLRTNARVTQARQQRAETGDETTLERIEGKSLTDRREEAQEASRQLDTYEKNRQALLDYQQQLEREQKILEQNEAARDKNREAIEKETGAVNEQRDKQVMKVSGGAVDKAIELSNRAAAGGSLTADEGRFVQQIGSLVSGQNQNLASAERILQMASQNPALLDKILARLAGVMEGNTAILQNWIAGMEAKMAGLQSRLDRPTQ